MEISKKRLDTIMQEYYYEKNDTDTTIDFLTYMTHMYEKLKQQGE